MMVSAWNRDGLAADEHSKADDEELAVEELPVEVFLKPKRHFINRVSRISLKEDGEVEGRHS
jgi:hypothetical protein